MSGAGIYAENDRNLGAGDIVIDARGGSIRTEGQYSHGIEGWSSLFDDVIIATHDGHSITTTGDDASGILGVVGGDDATLGITVGGTVTASGAKAHAVEVGTLSSGYAYQVAPVGEDGFRNQTVRVNGRVHGGSGEAAGVWLAGGGRVYIGPQGTLGADSGIAILATGDWRVQGGDPIKPALLVDMSLNGRQVAQVIGDDWIVNDGGETTIVVNNVTLHDGATGATGLTAANGAWNVTFRDAGVTVTDREDPANWVVSEPASGVVADRDFSAEDFTETRRPLPPVRTQTQPEPEPESEVSVETSGEQGGSVVLVEAYAPRAAVYEALPGALLRLGGPAAAALERLRLPGSPLWFRITGGKSSHEPEPATVGAEYDVDRVVAEAGAWVPLSEDLTGLIGAHLIRGSIDATAPTGGGSIAAVGRGVSAGLSWEGADGFYGDGSLSATWFDLSTASDLRGTLEEGVHAFVYALDLEAGRRFDVGEKTRLTARAWANRTDASLQRFTDAVGSRVSLADADALTLGAGGIIETDLAWNDGQESLTLHGSLGVERTVGGGETLVLVSGEELRSASASDGVVLGVGATRRWGRFALGAELRAGGLGSSDNDYSGRLSVRMAF